MNHNQENVFKSTGEQEKMKALRLKKAESQKRFREKKQEEEQSIPTKAIEKEVSELSEHIQNKRFRPREDTKRLYQMGPAAPTSEKKKASRLQKIEKQKYMRKKKREEENTILSKANELLRQKREMSSDENDVLRLAEQIKADRLKKSYKSKRYRQELSVTVTPEEKKALNLKLAESAKQRRRRKREKEQSILSKAIELQDQKREMSSEEKEVLRLAEQIKAYRLKRCEYSKRQYLKKRDSVGTHIKKEKSEARKLRKIEQENRYAAASSEERKALSLKRAENQRRYWLKKGEKEESVLRKADVLLTQNQELSSAEKEVIRLAEQIKADRLRKNEIRKQKRLRRNAATTPEEKNALRFQNSVKRRQNYEKLLSSKTPEELKYYRLMRTEESKRYYRKYKTKASSVGKGSPERKTSKHIRQRERLDEMRTSKQDRTKNAAGWLKKDQITSNFSLVFEKDVLQESKNNTIDMQQEGFNDSSRSWLELSEKSFMTGGTSESHRYFQSFYGGSFSIAESFENIYGHSRNIDKISELEESFRCMRVLIDAIPKRDGPALFGEQVAQKLRSTKKDVAEVSIAKQLIDNVLLNLAKGAYKSKT